MNLIYWFGYYLFRFVSLFYFPRTIVGRENLPKDTNFIVASNHISNLDPFIVGISAKRRFSYMAKEELFENKIGGFILKSLYAYPIKRFAADAGALRITLKRLKKGETVVLFPEGTRIEKNKNIEAGIGFIAVKSGLPVIPVHLEGTNMVLRPKAKWLKRHPVKVTFGRPIPIDRNRSYEEISHDIMDQVYALKK